MKRLTLTLCSLAFLFAACNNEKKTEDKTAGSDTTVTKTDDKKPEPYTMPDSATMWKAMQDYGTPGPQHAMMAKWDGTWNAEVTMWMEPGKPEVKSTATSVNKMMYNGLYQQSTTSGNMMGMPFTGTSTLGYDNFKKVFVNTWIDNMGSGIMYMEGPWDEATKTITLKGTGVNPAIGKECHNRQTFKIIDDNTQEMEMFTNGPDGNEMKVMHIKYTRKK